MPTIIAAAQAPPAPLPLQDMTVVERIMKFGRNEAPLAQLTTVLTMMFDMRIYVNFV